MRQISGPESRLLEELQNDFPLCPHPFAEIGERCGLAETEAIRATREFLEDGLIREISALLDGSGIGFKSTLVALKVAEGRIGTVAKRINAHPGVSHNYRRDHPFNIWFTLSLPRDRDFAQTVKQITDGEAELALILPALRTFKLRVHLPMQRESGKNPATPPTQQISGPVEAVPFTGFERSVLGRVENPLPVEALPWKAVSSDLGAEEAVLIDTVGNLKSRGIIRRIAAVLHHRRVGFTANGMAAFRVAENRIEAAGRQAAAFAEVSHCYRRRSYPEWPYSLYAMVHARTRAECSSVVQRISRAVDCSDYQLLFSTEEFKKQRIKYFGGY